MKKDTTINFSNSNNCIDSTYRLERNQEKFSNQVRFLSRNCTQQTFRHVLTAFSDLSSIFIEAQIADPENSDRWEIARGIVDSVRRNYIRKSFH